MKIFRPTFTLEGDPQRNQHQFMVLSSDEPFKVEEVEYWVDGQLWATQKTETELDVTQRLTIFPDALRKVQTADPSKAELAVSVAIRCRRLAAETVLKVNCLLAHCRKPGILVLRKA